MSFFHHNQNFDENFLERGIPRPDMRNMPPARNPSMDHDVNSRRFDPRTFQENRNMELSQHGNPAFRPPMDPRMNHHGPRGVDPRHNDMRFDPRAHNIDPRQTELRTYDRPPNAAPRMDPRINFSVGLPQGMGHQMSSMGPPMGSMPPGPHQTHHSAMVPNHPSHPQMHQPQNHSQMAGNSPFASPMMASFARPSVSEVVPVHVDLAAFAAEPKFQQILLKVKEQSAVNFISLNRVADDLVESIVIDAPTRDAALLAKNLIETHLKLQMKIKAAENRLQRVQTDLFSTQGEIASGQMVEFSIRPELIGLAIGKKGTRIKQIETDTGVSSINVSDNGHIMIYGPDSQSVQRAREQLELQEESFPLLRGQMEWMADKMNASVLADLKSGSGVMVAKVNRETLKLDVVGTGPAVQTAKFLLATQLEYIDKQIEIEMNEREARDKLNAVRKQYGLNHPQWKNKMGGKGNGHSGRSISPDDRKRSTDSREVQSVHYIDPARHGKGNKNSEAVVDSLVRAAMGGSNSRSVKSGEAGNNGKKEASTQPADPEDELDALISYVPETNSPSKKNPDPKNQNRKAKELVMQDTFLGTPLPADSTVKAESKQSKDKERKNNKKDKAEKKNNDKANSEKGSTNSGSDGLVIIPPAPLLTVPPPPQNGEKGKNKKEKGKKGELRNAADKAEAVKEDKKAVKEPMLVKINNPFLEQKGKKTDDVTENVSRSSRVVSIIPDSGEIHGGKMDKRRKSHDKSESHDVNADTDVKTDSILNENVRRSESVDFDKSGQNKRKKGKNNKKSGNEKEDEDSPLPGKPESSELSRLALLADLDRSPGKGPDSIHKQIEPPLPRKVKKGPPAIPNRVWDNDSASEDQKLKPESVPQDSERADHDDNASPAKKAAPVPPPPGFGNLSSSAPSSGEANVNAQNVSTSVPSQSSPVTETSQNEA